MLLRILVIDTKKTNCLKKLLKLKIGVFRTIGQEWLVTIDDAETYIPEVGEVSGIFNRRFLFCW